MPYKLNYHSALHFRTKLPLCKRRLDSRVAPLRTNLNVFIGVGSGRRFVNHSTVITRGRTKLAHGVIKVRLRSGTVPHTNCPMRIGKIRVNIMAANCHSVSASHDMYITVISGTCARLKAPIRVHVHGGIFPNIIAGGHFCRAGCGGWAGGGLVL